MTSGSMPTHAGAIPVDYRFRFIIIGMIIMTGFFLIETLAFWNIISICFILAGEAQVDPGHPDLVL